MLVRVRAGGGGGGAISDTTVDTYSEELRIRVASQRAVPSVFAHIGYDLHTVYALKQVPGRSQEWSATLSPVKTTHTLSTPSLQT